MNVTVVRADCTGFETPLLVVNVFEGRDHLAGPTAKVDEALGGRISDVLRRGDFRGKRDEVLLLYPPAGALGAERVLLVGLGKQADLTTEGVRRAAGAASKEALRLRIPRYATILHHAELVADRMGPRDAARAAAEGAVLGGYTFTEMKSRDRDEPPARIEEVTVLEKVEEKAREIEAGVRVGTVLARAECFARDLGNLPGNVATPAYLAEAAEGLGRDHGLKVTVLGRAELEAEGMRALLGVSAGSTQEPKLIVLEHGGGAEGSQPLVLVGKGVTFDSGGISIKPAASMEEMKFDMSGAGAVLAAMRAIAELEVPVHVVGIVPATENLPSGDALKPGDILRTHLGKTVEVVNTDAEGRLILADALSYARRFRPAAVVDAATLTGACVIALGHQAAAVMGNDEGLVEELRAAGERVGQRTWPLPMYEEFREQIRSDYADVKNSGGRPAGTITAAWFLREFVEGFPWAHLDVAGTAYGDGKGPYLARGSTGAPTRLFVEWVLSRAG